MWIHFDDKELELLKKALNRSKIYGDSDETDAVIALQLRISKQAVEDPIDAQYRNAVETSDELEVDDDAIVSISNDPGAWVHAWIWVTNEEAGISDPDEEDAACENCGNTLNDGSDICDQCGGDFK
ncbi:hypothetical protein [Mesorhizobium sp. CN2-181]|uniref:hypothetical protein n=1 Tax=Mesorhizobium yinganensis TaxID=3157707 RepID=UPI0032B774F2